MTEPATLWADLLVAGLISLVVACAVLLVAGLCRTASREMPPPPVEEPPAMPPALAAYIARNAVAELDREWDDLQRTIGGGA